MKYHALVEHNDNITGVSFAITSMKCYVPIELLQQTKILNFSKVSKEKF